MSTNTGNYYKTSFTASYDTTNILFGSLWSENFSGKVPTLTETQYQHLSTYLQEERVKLIYDYVTGSLSGTHPNWKVYVSQASFVAASGGNNIVFCPISGFG